MTALQTRTPPTSFLIFRVQSQLQPVNVFNATGDLAVQCLHRSQIKLIMATQFEPEECLMTLFAVSAIFENPGSRYPQCFDLLGFF